MLGQRYHFASSPNRQHFSIDVEQPICETRTGGHRVFKLDLSHAAFDKVDRFTDVIGQVVEFKVSVFIKISQLVAIAVGTIVDRKRNGRLGSVVARKMLEDRVAVKVRLRPRQNPCKRLAVEWMHC